MLNLSNINFSYPSFKIISDVNLKVKENEIVSVTGKKCAGKSTLFKLIAGLLKPDSGNVFFMGNDIYNASRKNLHNDIVFINRYLGLFQEMTVKENIELGAWSIKDKKVFESNLNKILELVPTLEKTYNKQTKFLCNGEKMLTSIARALISFPKLIVIDEPTLGFYPLFANKILELITKANQLGVTFLLMQQNLSHAVKISNWIYEMEEGEIIKQGDAQSFRKFDLGNE